MKLIKVEPIILLFAFRYALGRMSYAPSLVTLGILENLDAFETHGLIQMVNEIQEVEEKLGMECDKRMWIYFKKRLITEIERREEK